MENRFFIHLNSIDHFVETAENIINFIMLFFLDRAMENRSYIHLN